MLYIYICLCWWNGWSFYWPDHHWWDGRGDLLTSCIVFFSLKVLFFFEKKIIIDLKWRDRILIPPCIYNVVITRMHGQLGQKNQVYVGPPSKFEIEIKSWSAIKRKSLKEYISYDIKIDRLLFISHIIYICLSAWVSMARIYCTRFLSWKTFRLLKTTTSLSKLIYCEVVVI